jgi:hypothetical protein
VDEGLTVWEPVSGLSPEGSVILWLMAPAWLPPQALPIFSQQPLALGLSEPMAESSCTWETFIPLPKAQIPGASVSSPVNGANKATCLQHYSWNLGSHMANVHLVRWVASSVFSKPCSEFYLQGHGWLN